MNFLFINGTEMVSPTVYKQKFELKSPVYPPLGLLYVAKSLEDEGHKVQLVDFYLDENPFNEIEKLIANSDAIGMTVDNDCFEESAELAKYIKSLDSSIPIITGGPYCTLYSERALNGLPDVDITVCGDGEIAIKDIALALKGSKKFSDINGIHYRENGKVESGKTPILIEDLDSISIPSRHLVEKYDYGKFGDIDLFAPRLTSMVTTRGCPFRCRYCIRPLISYKKFRQRSAGNVLAELQEINNKYNTVMIGDDTFLVDIERAHKILDGIIDLELELDILIGGMRVDIAERELYYKMKKARVKHVNFGIESGNQDVLDFYNKKVNINQVKKAVKLCDEMGFFTNASFILGAPIETRDHINNTINFACSLPLDLVIFYPLSYRHGSDLWTWAVEKGSINENEHEVIADCSRDLGNFTEEEIKRFCSMGLKKFYLRPSYFYREFVKALRTKDNGLLKVILRSMIRPAF